MLTQQQEFGLRASLDESFAALPADDLQDYLDELAGELNAAELAGLGKAFRKLGSGVSRSVPAIGRAGQQALPGVIQGATTGATVGGPWGALIGGLAGGGLSLAGAQGKPGPKTPGRPAPSRPMAVTAPAVRPTAASVPAAQLLAMMQNPQVLQALLGLALGSAGKQTVPVGGANVNAGALAGLIRKLAENVEESAAMPGGYYALTESAEADSPDADELYERLNAGNSDWQDELATPEEWLQSHGYAEFLDDDHWE